MKKTGHLNAKKLIVLLILFGWVWTSNLQAQTQNDQLKSYYSQAEAALENQSYDKALDYGNQIEKIQGSSDVYLEALRVKIFAEKGDLDKAREVFTNYVFTSRMKS